MTNEQKIAQAIQLLTEVYKTADPKLALSIEIADSYLFDVLAIVKGI